MLTQSMFDKRATKLIGSSANSQILKHIDLVDLKFSHKQTEKDSELKMPLQGERTEGSKSYLFSDTDFSGITKQSRTDFSKKCHWNIRHVGIF